MKKIISICLIIAAFAALLVLPSCEKKQEKKTDTEASTENVTEPITEPATETEAPKKEGKKYFTLSFDDGITQDLKIMEICKKYGFTGCTFNINTGLCGVNWEWVGQQFNRPDVTHQRFTEEELRSGVYDGFDVEVHTLHHPSLKQYDTAPLAMKSEVQGDADNIYDITGVKPVGMAWPGGDTEYTEATAHQVVANTDIRFARTITSTYSYALPEYFMMWNPTCSISDNSVLNLAKSFLLTPCDDGDMLFYVWGHGYELDLYDNYGTLEELIKMMTEAEDVEIVTNAQFYELFKDQIPSWK